MRDLKLLGIIVVRLTQMTLTEAISYYDRITTVDTEALAKLNVVSGKDKFCQQYCSIFHLNTLSEK